MCGVWGYCRAKKQLLSITSAPSGVISKQTDWNQPTEVSPRGERGMDTGRLRGERVGVDMAKQQEDEKDAKDAIKEREGG